MLDKRLNAVKNLIDKDIIADIGADHGKLVVSCVLTGIVEKAYAVDISEKSLFKAKILANEHEIDDKITFLCSDGLSNLPKETNIQIVIAGMGGNEIIKILSNEKRVENIFENFILVPHQNAKELRAFLSGKFNIDCDFVVMDGKKFYDVIKVSAGCHIYNEDEMILGKNSPKSIDFEKKVIHKLDYLNQLIKKNKEVSNDVIYERNIYDKTSKNF